MELNESPQPKYLPDEFTKEDFANMTSDTMYAFYSAPDTGKTTLIMTVFQDYLRESGKKALYLTSRTAIIEQNGAMVDRAVMTCCTYQLVESKIDGGGSFPDHYDFIVCDEAHYFVDDALLGGRTDLSFKFINDSKAIIILMSGTPEYVECLSDQWRRPINILKMFDKTNHNVATVCLAPVTREYKDREYYLKEQLYKLASQGKRIVVYDSNIADLWALYTMYEGRQQQLSIRVSFICSKHNKKYFPYCDTEQLKVLVETDRIDTNMLFITSALNTGISIDEDFEYLFIFGNPSKTAIRQLIARVRKGKQNRKLKTVFCSVPSYHSICARKNQIEQDLLFFDNKEEWQLKKRTRNLPAFVQDAGTTKNEYVFNPMILEKFRQDVTDYNDILTHHSVLEAYQEFFKNNYAGISIIPLGILLLVDKLNCYRSLPYLSKSQSDKIKDLCHKHHILSYMSEINKVLSQHGYTLKLVAGTKRIKGKKQRVWKIES